MLSTRRRMEKRFGFRINFTRLAIEEQSANSFANLRAAGFASADHPLPICLQRNCELTHLGAFAGPFWSLERDEQARHRVTAFLAGKSRLFDLAPALCFSILGCTDPPARAAISARTTLAESTQLVAPLPLPR